MPSSKGYKRNYRQEYDNYHGKPDQIKKRANRVKARRKMEKAGKVSKGDGKDVAHANNNTKDNSAKNLKAQPASKNRSFPRTKTARRKK